MAREQRVIRRINDEAGTLIDHAGVAHKIQFELTHWQDFIDDIPSLRSGSSSIRSENESVVYPLFESGKPLLLQGGDVQASVLLIGLNASQVTFKVTGPITDLNAERQPSARFAFVDCTGGLQC